MPFLDQRQLHEVANAILTAKLDDPDNRGSLLLGIPDGYISGRLPDNNIRKAQVESDLSKMNEDGILEEDCVPLRLYLENCRYRAAASSRPERKIFEKCRDLVDAHLEASRRPFLYVVGRAGAGDDPAMVLADLIAANETLLQEGGPLEGRPPFAPGVAVVLPGGDASPLEALAKAGRFLLYRMQGLADVESVSGEMRQQIPGFLAKFAKPGTKAPTAAAPPAAPLPAALATGRAPGSANRREAPLLPRSMARSSNTPDCGRRLAH
jgi:hypothetical protein